MSAEHHHVKWKFQHSWQIDKNSVYAIEWSNGNKLETKSYENPSIPGLKYHLKLCNFGNNNVRFYFVVERQQNIHLKVNYTVSVLSAEFTDEKEFLIKNEQEQDNCTKLFRYHDAFDDDLFINDLGKLVIKINGYFQILQFNRFNPEPKSLAASLWNMEESKDVEIVVGETVLKVHGWVIEVNSTVFQVALANDKWKEAKEKKLQIKDFTTKVVQDAVEFCYQRDIKPSLGVCDNIKDYLAFADKYDMKELMDFVQMYCIDYRVTAETVCDMINCASTYNALKLYEFCMLLLLDGWKNTHFDGYENLDKHILKDFGKRCLAPMPDTVTNNYNI